MKDWEKWKNKFLRSWSNSMKWLVMNIRAGRVQAVKDTGIRMSRECRKILLFGGLCCFLGQSFRSRT